MVYQTLYCLVVHQTPYCLLVHQLTRRQSGFNVCVLSCHPQVLINGVPLTDDGATTVTSSVELLEESLVTALSRHTGRLQRSVFRGELTDIDDATDFLMKQPHVVPR